ncbi:MAG: ribonuclease Z [Capnocytophaga sp.]|nr:ribonuclease Z [Capnocytophaga sp.]
MKKEKAKVIKLTKQELPTFITDFKKDNELKESHIILDLLEIQDLEGKDLKDFVEISKHHSKKNKKSFVIVNKEITYGDIPNELNLTPSLQEAYDIIEMEDIQRDLGF